MSPPLPPLRSWPARLCQRFPGPALHAIQQRTQGRWLLALVQPLRAHTRFNLILQALAFGMLVACLWAIQVLAFPGDAVILLVLVVVATVMVAGPILGLRHELRPDSRRDPHLDALLLALSCDPHVWQQLPSSLTARGPLFRRRWVAELACLGFLPEGQARLRLRHLAGALAGAPPSVSRPAPRPRL